MNRIEWNIDLSDLPPDPTPPPEGWHKPCLVEDHSWVLNVEDGRASIRATTKCDPNLVDPSGPAPSCSTPWNAEDLFADGIPVAARFVDESTPSTPAGPAEYSFYIELTAPEVSS